MSDLEQRFRSLARTPAPDVWDDATDREPRAPLGPSRPAQLVTVVVALAVAVGGMGITIVMFTQLRESEVATDVEPVDLPSSTVTLPDVVGLDVDEARRRLGELGYRVDVRHRGAHEADVSGVVVEQRPPGETDAAPGDIVTLVVGVEHRVAQIGLGVDVPEVGIAVFVGGETTFLDTDGNVLTTLANVEIVGNPGAPGVWLGFEGETFTLDPGTDDLRPMRTDESAYDEGPNPQLPAPPSSAGGHWRYAYASPRHDLGEGRATLAQWSGECESPVAYWVDSDGTMTAITGEDSIADAPESVALGWTPDGAAIVFLPVGLCGGDATRPGIYRFTAPGEGELLFATHDRMATADMWGSS